jgi:hypothetical protein
MGSGDRKALQGIIVTTQRVDSWLKNPSFAQFSAYDRTRTSSLLSQPSFLSAK